MDTWGRFERACLRRFGVGDTRLARDHGISADRFFQRTAREGWRRPQPGIRIHPDSDRCVQQQLVVAARSTADVAGASGDSGAWLHGLRDRPPRRPSILVQHATRARSDDGVTVRRARWLEPGDVEELDGVPTLRPEALLVSSLDLTRRDLLARVLDIIQRRLATPRGIRDRLARIGPLPGKALLREHAELAARYRIESVFQDEVADQLERLGYRPDRSTRRIETPDGRGLTIDVPLMAWQVAVEPDGDTFHRTREQRRSDRRREGAFAGTDWVRVPVDLRDWHLDRQHVLDVIDHAIAAQRRRGIGTANPLPRR